MDADARLLLRRRDAALMLAVSESQIVKWERAGVIESVRVPGLRAVRFRAADVRSLAANIALGVLSVSTQ